MSAVPVGLRELRSSEGFIAWEGPSPITGSRAVLIVTGGSTNEKTGPMAQMWMLLQNVSPLAAVQAGADAAVCGDCKLRRSIGGGTGRKCYVNLFTGGPTQVWRAYQRGSYPRAVDLVETQRRLEGVFCRVTAYGDPAILPARFWMPRLQHTAGWVGYTHLWRRCDQNLRELFMASVDSEKEHLEALGLGWRTFRNRPAAGRLLAREFVCPASDEGQHRATCLECRLCSGHSSEGRNPVIVTHGKAARRPEPWGKHRELTARLKAGEEVRVEQSGATLKRTMLAVRQALRRQGSPATLHTKRVDRFVDGNYRFWLEGLSNAEGL